jgi:hypothetical protein
MVRCLIKLVVSARVLSLQRQQFGMGAWLFVCLFYRKYIAIIHISVFVLDAVLSRGFSADLMGDC